MTAQCVVHHTFITGAVLLVLFIPRTSWAQCEWNNVSLYSDGYYSEVTLEWTIYSQGDDMSAGCCFHTYGTEIVAATQVSTHYIYDPEIVGEMTRFYDEPGPVTYTARFWVECWCIMTVVGFAEVPGEVQLPPTLPCVPGLQMSLMNHRFKIGTHQFWEAHSALARSTAGMWTNLVHNRNPSVTAYVEMEPRTTTIEINPNYSGTTTWGVALRGAGPPLNPVWINSDISAYGPFFMGGVLLHEWGHQRGYGHVPNSCGNRSIMKEFRAAGEEEPYDLGPGDTAATERDVPPT